MPLRPWRAARIIAVSGIYDEPELYELACAYRDIPAEVTATPGLVRHALRRRGWPARSVLELAAGPAEHARELARRGLSATRSTGPPRCARMRPAGPSAAGGARCRPGGHARLPIAGPDGDPVKFDLAITMLNSACHLFTLDDLVRHLAAVRAHLAPDGLYIVELAHPADFFAAGAAHQQPVDDRRGRRHADVRWGGRADRIDPLTQVTREHMTITATFKDGTIRTVSDVVPNRFWSLTEFTAAIGLANAIDLTAPGELARRARARARAAPPAASSWRVPTATSTSRPAWTPRARGG